MLVYDTFHCVSLALFLYFLGSAAFRQSVRGHSSIPVQYSSGPPTPINADHIVHYNAALQGQGKGNGCMGCMHGVRNGRDIS